ncbi:hypothetical protein ABW19_dt0205525 [Dactylella cylindrospora]|nr:hypothetical protein ABW19_dt0205525 [Dactylella cylindrospora]
MSLPANSNVVLVNSTGQTVEDLIGLKALWEILQVDNNKYLSDGWLPPALTDPNYVPERQEAMKIGLTVAFLFGILITGMLVTFKIVTTQRGRMTRMLFLEDWLLIVALVSAHMIPQRGYQHVDNMDIHRHENIPVALDPPALLWIPYKDATCL